MANRGVDYLGMNGIGEIAGIGTHPQTSDPSTWDAATWAYVSALAQAQNQQPQYEDTGSNDGGGYDSGGGGGGYSYAPPPVQPILESSAEWQAYLNALGLEKTQFAADIERQRALAKSQAEYNLSQVEPQFDPQRRNITASAEGRGMARSGQLQRSLAENRASEERTKAGIQQGLDTSVSGLESQLAQKNIDIASRQAQQKATMIGQGYKSDPTAGLGAVSPDPTFWALVNAGYFK